MPQRARIEQALDQALAVGEARGAPPRFVAAMRHAVFPGGARVRPQLCLAVAAACGNDAPELACASAVAIELMHCASLVHDDLPCFDDAPTRRGRPSVHAAFGERLAVLAGDALIVLAFRVLGQCPEARRRSAELCTMLAERVGPPFGIVCGQAWECEDWVALPDYQQAKTGSLFVAAAEMGAVAAGASPAPWREFGECLGEAYQVADDIRDVAADPEWLGKPTGRDMKLGRPNAVHEKGMDAAVAHFDALVQRAARAVPAGSGAVPLRALLRHEAERLLPPSLVPRREGASLQQVA
jgi:geranylgeranyl diphosphate synthase, type II